MFFTHVRELFGDVVLKPVVRPLRWSNMATMPALPETQESIKEEIRRQVCLFLQTVCPLPAKSTPTCSKCFVVLLVLLDVSVEVYAYMCLRGILEERYFFFMQVILLFVSTVKVHFRNTSE